MWYPPRSVSGRHCRHLRILRGGRRRIRVPSCVLPGPTLDSLAGSIPRPCRDDSSPRYAEVPALRWSRKGRDSPRTVRTAMGPRAASRGPGAASTGCYTLIRSHARPRLSRGQAITKQLACQSLEKTHSANGARIRHLSPTLCTIAFQLCVVWVTWCYLKVALPGDPGGMVPYYLCQASPHTSRKTGYCPYSTPVVPSDHAPARRITVWIELRPRDDS